MSKKIYNSMKLLINIRNTGLLLLSLSMMGTFCEDNNTTADGKVDHPAAPQCFRSGDQSYALVAMPQIGHLRVFDMVAEDFVPAPNVYFPLSIPVGPFSQKMALNSDAKVALVLDASDGALRALRIGSEADADSFKRLGPAQPAGLNPQGLAIDSSAAGLRYFVSSARSQQVVAFVSDTDFSEAQIDQVWNLDGRPGDIVYAPAANKIFVSDELAAALWVIDNDDDSVQKIVLPAPARSMRLGQVSLAAGQAAQELLMVFPTQDAMISLVDTQTETLLASVESPSFPQDALMLDGETADDGKCSGLGRDAPCAYAAVLALNGSLQYLDLQSQNSAGQWTPRFVDGDSTEPEMLPLDENPQLYDPNSEAEDAQARRPLVQLTVVDDFGQPAKIYQRASGSYLFTWQGLLPALRDRQGQLQLGDSSFIDADDAQLDFAALGVVAGDLLEIPAQQACSELRRYVISAVSSQGLSLAGLDSASDCMAVSGGLRYRVRAADSFTVASKREEEAQGLLGRVAFGEDFDAHAVRIQLRRALGGAPDTGAVLNVSVDDHFSPRSLDLGLRGALPSGISGGLMGSGDAQAYNMLVSVAGGSALFAIVPGIEGYVDSTYLLTGVKRFQ